MTVDEADVQGQSKGEESLSQRLPISYSLLDPGPQRQRTAAALQDLEGRPPHPLSFSESRAQLSSCQVPLEGHLTEKKKKKKKGLLGDSLIF